MAEGRITRRGCEVSRDLVRAHMRELTVSPTSSGPAQPPPFNVFCPGSTPDTVLVPHFWARGVLHGKGGACTDDRAPGAPAPNLQFVGTLQPHLRQPQGAAAILQSFEATHGGAVLCASTGQGKTVLGLFTACTLKLKTLVLVHKSFLADQWIERARQFVPSAQVTQFGMGKHDVSGDIVVATIQTVLARNGVPGGELFGLVIVDEVHRIAASKFSQVLFCGLAAPHILGLSATPTRPDGCSKVIHWLCGPLVEASPGTGPGGGDQFSVRVHRRMYPPARRVPTTRFGTMDHATLLTQLGADQARTEFIVASMKDLISRDTDCLVLSHRRAHCLALATMLCAEGYEAATYLGGDTAIPTARVLVSTYSLVSEGFDQPRLRALVLATPASAITQVVGRILRASGAAAASPGRRTILDILDGASVCYAQAIKRRRVYIAKGFSIDSSTQGAAAGASETYMFRESS